MDFEAIKWIIGLFTALVIALITAFRHLSVKVSASAAILHTKVDRVKDDYVRRDDLKEYLEPIRRGQQATNEKLDRLFERMSKQ